MNIKESSDSISNYLTQLSIKTFITNKIGDYGVNKYAENALIGFLNILLDCKFSNTNQLNNQFPAIDLIDKEKMCAVQITSDSSFEKVKNCIEKFFSHGIYRDVDKLYVYILTIKEKKYNQKSLDEYIKICRTKYEVSDDVVLRFDVGIHIIDGGVALNMINDRNDSSFSIQLLNELKKEFAKITVKENLTSYNNDLIDKFDEIVMNDDQGMKLSDIYIHPNITFHISCTEPDDSNDLVKSSTSEFSLNHIFFSHQYFNKYFIPQKKHPKIKNSRIALLLGYPGQGKTSFCKKLLYDFMQEKNDKDIFYFKLKDVPNTHHLINNPFNTLFETLRQNIGQDIDIQTFRKSVIVLDGLDELFMKEGLKLDDIEWFCISLIRDVERIPDLQLIITSRKHYVDINKLLSENISIIQLEPLSTSQQKEWLVKYKKFHPTTWLTAKALKENAQTYLGEMLEQPILLHFIASLKKDINSNTTRTEIYNKLFSQIIERKYSADGQIQILKNLKLRNLRELIQEIAFAIYQTGNGYISKNQLINNKIIQRYLSRFPSNDFKENLKGVMVSFYFNEKEINSDNNQDFVVEFIHKSLEEYMVAEKITHTIVNAVINKDSNDEYIINDFFDALKVINSLFSSKILSDEISTYIEDILICLPAETKTNVGNRLLMFLPGMCQSDFLYEYDCKIKNSPIIISMCSFGLIWSFLRIIFPNENLVNDGSSAKIFYFITNIESHYIEIEYKDINYQHFSNIKLYGLGSFKNSRLKHVTLEKCEFLFSNFTSLQMENVIFINSSFSGVMRECSFTNCIFENMSFDDVIFIDCKFNNVDFRNSEFTGCELINSKFNNAKTEHFDGVSLDSVFLLTLIKMKVIVNLPALKKILYNNISHDVTDKIIVEITRNEFANI